MRVARSSSFAAALRANPAVFLGSQRSFSSDALAMPDTRVDMKYGGRQSVSGVTCTVFGAYGFIGRYVVNRLGRIGTQCVIPYRGDGMNTRHLKLMGDLGQIVHTPIDLTDPESIAKAVERSDVVINMIGARNPTKNYSMDDVHVKVCHRIAKICAEAGNIKRFIHLSAAGADPASESNFLASKGKSEEVVRDFFPQATIIRPTDVFGHEDKFLNKMAEMMRYFPITPVLGDGTQKLQPIYVQDVAQCIVNAMVNTDAPGKVYTLGGPEVISKSELLEWVARNACRYDATVLSMPEWAVRTYAQVVEKVMPVKWRHICPDQVVEMASDNIVPKDVLGCQDLGVKPVTLEKAGPDIMIRHRGKRDPTNYEWGLPQRMGKIQN